MSLEKSSRGRRFLEMLDDDSRRRDAWLTEHLTNEWGHTVKLQSLVASIDDFVSRSALNIRSRCTEKPVDQEVLQLVDYSILANVVFAISPDARHLLTHPLQLMKSQRELLELPEIKAVSHTIAASIVQFCHAVEPNPEGSITLTGEPDGCGHIIEFEGRRITLPKGSYATLLDLILVRAEGHDCGYGVHDKVKIHRLRKPIDSIMRWDLGHLLIGNAVTFRAKNKRMARYRINMDPCGFRLSSTFQYLAADGVVDESKLQQLNRMIAT